MVWMDLQKNEKNCHKMALSQAIVGQILAILRITDQNRFFNGNRYSSLDNFSFDLKIGIQVLCRGQKNDFLF